MLITLLPPQLDKLAILIGYLGLTLLGTIGFALVVFYTLRSIFRKFERDIALVTLNVSIYPASTIFILVSLRQAVYWTTGLAAIPGLERSFLGILITTTSYWVLQLFSQVVIYYLKEYTETTEAMWDEVLLPLIEGVIPVLIVLVGGSLILQASFGVDLTGAWLTLGGATFVIGLAAKDILANFFSGIVLLIDSPFQFGDILRLDDGSLGILQKIGVRVTQLYLFESHTEVHIPNSVLQNQKITNLSRPIEPIYYSLPIELNPNCDLEAAKALMQEIIQAHPDTLGNIDHKLSCLERYFQWKDKTKDRSRERLLAEQKVNVQLEAIEHALEALMITLQFAEKDGLDADEIETIQEEFDYILELIGLTAVQSWPRQSRRLFFSHQPRSAISLTEDRGAGSLIGLVQDWYRIWLRDPHVVYNDQYVLPEIWERKIQLLKRRTQRLYQKILHPQREETRIDDYVKDLIRWLRDRFKQARSEWQEPDVRMERVVHLEGYTYVQFTLNYYVDDIRLEDGERGHRVGSDIHREIMHHLKQACLTTAQ